MPFRAFEDRVDLGVARFHARVAERIGELRPRNLRVVGGQRSHLFEEGFGETGGVEKLRAVALLIDVEDAHVPAADEILGDRDGIFQIAHQRADFEFKRSRHRDSSLRLCTSS